MADIGGLHLIPASEAARCIYYRKISDGGETPAASG
jgi:hypothetical protein